MARAQHDRLPLLFRRGQAARVREERGSKVPAALWPCSWRLPLLPLPSPLSLSVLSEPLLLVVLPLVVLPLRWVLQCQTRLLGLRPAMAGRFE